MYNFEDFKNIEEKYGNYSSWAIWDYLNEKDCSVIGKNINILNSNYVILALNISGSLRNIPWINFHGGKHDRKLKYAFNDTNVKGAYITDLFKDLPEVNSGRVKYKITDEILKKNINFFIQEMKDVKFSENSQFIIMGNEASRYYERYFKEYFNNKVNIYTHYSSYSKSDREWVTGIWDKLNIEANFSDVIIKYKKNEK